MSFKLTILGCSSAVPNLDKHPSAQLLNSNENLFLIDCGECTQIRLRENKQSFQKISHIFISHLHGDHFYGLIGLINSMHLLGREKELHIYSHLELKNIINIQLRVSSILLNFPIFFHEISKDSGEIIFENEEIVIENIILDHRIACSGFVFRENKYKRKINKEAILKYKIPDFYLSKIRSGNDFINSKGEIIKNRLITKKRRVANSYAYCSDTRFKKSIIKKIEGVDVLYHDSTFLKKHYAIANKTGHTTAYEAGIIARDSNVKLLVLGHFSRRYTNLDLLKIEAQKKFSNVILARNGLQINFKEQVLSN
tara:strand:+ start:595 stop:1527 length:933 start_codon:yes stop_codon:yes gene_type:complete